MWAFLKGFKLSLTSYVSLAFVFFLFISAGTLVAVNYYLMSTSAVETTLKQFDRAIKLEKENIREHLTPASFRLNLHTSQKKWQKFQPFKRIPTYYTN